MGNGLTPLQDAYADVRAKKPNLPQYKAYLEAAKGRPEVAVNPHKSASQLGSNGKVRSEIARRRALEADKAIGLTRMRRRALARLEALLNRPDGLADMPMEQIQRTIGFLVEAETRLNSAGLLDQASEVRPLDYVRARRRRISQSLHLCKALLGRPERTEWLIGLLEAKLEHLDRVLTDH